MTELQLNWTHARLAQLSAERLFDIAELRQAVFVLEQACLYPDLDNTDKHAVHLCGYIGDDLALYARVIPAGVTYPEASIGRIVTARKYRGAGLGKILIARAIDLIERTFGRQAIKIGAQAALRDYYQEFGFVAVSKEYLEDGIPHIDMLREART